MTLSRYRIDEEGRECSKCIEYKPWKNADGTTNFSRDFRSTTGFGSWCKVCRNTYASKPEKRDHREARCAVCGAAIEKPTAKYCDWCRMKRNRLAQGNWYLVLRDPSECSPSLGRQFDALSFGMDLKTGHAVEGMLVQHIAWGKPQGLHVVRGKSLKVQWLEAVE